MANQHTKAAADAAELAGAPSTAPDAPDLTPDLTPELDAEPTLRLTQADLDAMLSRVADDAAERATRAAHRQQLAHPPTLTPASLTAGAVFAKGTPPTEPTYEAGEVDEEGVAYAATIVAVSPLGVEVEVTPKVFRTIMAGLGYVAHPADAQQHQGNEPKRSRRSDRSANVDGTTELAAATRRRRRAAPAAE